MTRRLSLLPLLALLLSLTAAAPKKPADDPMIVDYLKKEAERLGDKFLDGAEDAGGVGGEAAAAAARVPRHARPLAAAGEDAAERDGHRHARTRATSSSRSCTSRAGPACTSPATCTGPKTVEGKLPAVLYVCGHSGRGRDGNKTAFQDHGMWFAANGYVCLIIDTLQLGEIAGKHHGTYNLGRWWWQARGYTPAGVECWNGIRAIDYLVSRPDVDAERIGVTGISGGGAATVWIAAADERVKVAVPVSGMSDLESYVTEQGHQRPLRLHVPRQHLPVGVDDHRRPDRPAAAAVRQLATTTASSRWTATAASSAKLRKLYKMYDKPELRGRVRQRGRPRLPAGPARRRLQVDQQAPEGRDRRRSRTPNFKPLPGKELRVFPEDKDVPEGRAQRQDRRDVRAVGKARLPARGLRRVAEGIVDETTAAGVPAVSRAGAGSPALRPGGAGWGRMWKSSPRSRASSSNWHRGRARTARARRARSSCATRRAALRTTAG